jgi:hypothetical protein
MLAITLQKITEIKVAKWGTPKNIKKVFIIHFKWKLFNRSLVHKRREEQLLSIPNNGQQIIFLNSFSNQFKGLNLTD